MTRIIFVGGYLGAGKTSLILRAAERLRGRGQRVGIVTNDQSEGLVDTRMVELSGFSVAEVAGGCFCCRFEDLRDAFQRVQHGKEIDVILAEPVGSCTDIISTVVRPLMRSDSERFEIAPFSVLIDPLCNHDVEDGVLGYLYRQQIAEADAIVLSKIDLDPGALVSVKRRYEGILPDCELFPLSSVSGDGVDAWLNFVLSTHVRDRTTLCLDYGRYAEAESALGWFNGSGLWYVASSTTLVNVAEKLVRALRDVLSEGSVLTEHVKLIVASGAGQVKASLLEDGRMGLDILNGETKAVTGELLLNVRVLGSPDVLRDAIMNALGRDSGIQIRFDHFECFKPNPPRPTHRINRNGVTVPLNCSDPLSIG